MSDIGAKLLLIDDDPRIRKILRISLEASGYDVSESSTAREATFQVAEQKPGLILLDLQLPDSTGLQLLQTLREATDIPVIVISVLDSEQDKINLLDAGANDYLTKPFSIPELLARIRAALRTRNSERSEGGVLQLGHLAIDFEKRSVLVNNQAVHLTPTEYSLLQLFIKNQGKVLTKETLIHEIWGPQSLNESGALRVHINQLRRKIELNPGSPQLLRNEPGIGYRLVVDSDVTD